MPLLAQRLSNHVTMMPIVPGAQTIEYFAAASKTIRMDVKFHNLLNPKN